MPTHVEQATPNQLISGAATELLVLIHPPAVSKRYLNTKFMPYGMAVLYAYLRQNGVPVAQFDFLMEYLFRAPRDLNYHDPEKSFSDEDFFSHLNEGRHNRQLERFARKYGERLPIGAPVYAFSVVAYHQFWASLVLARFIKDRNPGAVTVFGGPFITIKPARMFEPYQAHVDYFVQGSGEEPLLAIYRHVIHHGPGTPLQVPGLLRKANGGLVAGERAGFPAREEPPPDFAGLDLEVYRYDHPVTGKQALFLPYRLSKGCPSRCSFCTGRLVDDYDVKPVDKAVRELKFLAQKYETTDFMFADASINGHPGRLEELCSALITEFPDINWYAYARLRGCSPQLLAKMRKAGCFSLFWGVESAHQPTIELLGKRFVVDHLYELIDAAIDVGIKNYVHLMYNAPGETPEAVDAAIRLIERYIDCDLVVFLPQRFLLEPQSLMFEHPEAYGLAAVEQVAASPFDREQYNYGELSGLSPHDVKERNARHQNMLADHLEWVRYRNLTAAGVRPFARRVPPRLLVRTGKLARKSRVMSTIHKTVVRYVESGRRDPQELM